MAPFRLLDEPVKGLMSRSCPFHAAFGLAILARGLQSHELSAGHLIKLIKFVCESPPDLHVFPRSGITES